MLNFYRMGEVCVIGIICDAMFIYGRHLCCNGLDGVETKAGNKLETSCIEFV